MEKKKVSKNYLENIPVVNEKLSWSTDGKSVTLEIKNEGLMNKIAQKLFKKPKVSYVHLDEMGSFIWPLINGERTITHIAEFVKEKFGKEAEPLYERLAKYFQILSSYNFIYFK